MLNIPFGRTRFCDGVLPPELPPGRHVRLRCHVVLTSPTSYRAEAAASQARFPQPSTRRSSTSSSAAGRPIRTCGTSRPTRPSEIRGEFKPIATNVPGIQIGEVFPRIAAHGGQVRGHPLASSVRRGGHDAFQCMTGWPQQSLAGDGRPAEHRRRGRASCRAASIRRCRRSSAWPRRPQHVPWSRPGAGRLPRRRYAPFKPTGPDMANMTAQRRQQGAACSDRKKLLTSFDDLRRDIDATGAHARARTRHTRTGLRRADVEQAAGGARPVEGDPQDPRALRRRQAVQVPVRRRPDGQRAVC